MLFPTLREQYKHLLEREQVDKSSRDALVRTLGPVDGALDGLGPPDRLKLLYQSSEFSRVSPSSKAARSGRTPREP